MEVRYNRKLSVVNANRIKLASSDLVNSCRDAECQ